MQKAGSGLAGGTTSKVYLSTDATITTTDTVVGSANDAALAAGANSTDSMSITVPGNLGAGTYYIGVIADANGQVTESDETNNASTPVQITVTGTTAAPD